jgi:hypothetical protein
LLRITRAALERCNLSKRWVAEHVLHCSEQLAGKQLSDDNEDKHLSMRKMSRLEDAGFWREFLYLLAEDLGLDIVVVTREQRAALQTVVAASADLQRVWAGEIR